jgi:hypothetical protein
MPVGGIQKEGTEPAVRLRGGLEISLQESMPGVVGRREVNACQTQLGLALKILLQGVGGSQLKLP